MKKTSLFVASTLLATSLVSTLGAKEFVKVGTGSMEGTYYPVGGAICRLVNKNKQYKCSVEATGASIYNVNNVMKGELNFGFVQSDVMYEKYNGTGKFQGKADKNLRAIVSIYPELLAMVVAKSENIKSISDLKDKIYNVGNPGSGTSSTTYQVFDAFKLNPKDLRHVGVLTVGECPMALKDKKIQGYSFVVGHPTANITDAANSLPIDILDVDGKAVDELIAKYPYYARGTILNGTYEGVNKDVKTIGVKAVLAASKDQSEESVKAVVKAILDNFEEYKNLHPALKSVTKESLIEGLGAPLHPASEAVFKQYGIIK